MMSKIRITDLHLRTIIGANDWEREVKQDVVINIEIDFDAAKSIQSDNLKDTVDYKKITKDVIAAVESSEFYLLEKLTSTVLDIVLRHGGVHAASVKIDKPEALRFSKSVSVELSKTKDK